MNIRVKASRNQYFRILPILLMSSICLSGCDRSDKPKPRLAELETSLYTEERRLELAALKVEFDKLAPDGWVPSSYQSNTKIGHKGKIKYVNYLIDVRSQLPKTPKKNVSASITLNANGLLWNALVTDHNALVTDHDDSSDAIREDSSDAIRDASARYPKFDGYRVFAAVNNRGYNHRYEQEIRSVAYRDKEKGIYCKGLIVGEFTCVWGTQKQQYSIHFHSEDIAIMLPYISKLAKES